MYGIFTYIYPKFKPNVGKYTIHGSYGSGNWNLWFPKGISSSEGFHMLVFEGTVLTIFNGSSCLLFVGLILFRCLVLDQFLSTLWAFILKADNFYLHDPKPPCFKRSRYDKSQLSEFQFWKYKKIHGFRKSGDWSPPGMYKNSLKFTRGKLMGMFPTTGTNINCQWLTQPDFSNHQKRSFTSDNVRSPWRS